MEVKANSDMRTVVPQNSLVTVERRLLLLFALAIFVGGLVEEREVFNSKTFS